MPSADFDEEPLNEHIRDMSWLGPRALAHDRVNGQLWERADTLVPLAFGSVFRDDARVTAMLGANEAAFRARLDRVRGRGEYVVSMRRDRPLDDSELTAASEQVRALREELAAASPGRAHLMRRRLAELETDERRRVDDRAAQELLDALRGVADGVFVEPIPAQAVDRPMLRATILIGQRERELPELTERWRARGYELSLSGPTPPYRFTALE